MDSLTLRTKVIAEVNLVADDKLEELYNFIHYFRLGVEVSQDLLNPTMEFAAAGMTCQMKCLLISAKK